MNPRIAIASEEFSGIFGDAPLFYGDAPGRVEILGNHTDYNEGFALAAAVDRTVTVVGRPVPGNISRAYSLTFKSGASFDAANPVKSQSDAWLNYMMAAAWQLGRQECSVGAFEALVMGDVPLGAGLSSSAALEMATGNFIAAMLGAAISPLDMAVAMRAAENDFVGVQCGILDQWTCSMGEEGKALLLDCRALKILSRSPVPGNLRLVILDAASPHRLEDGEYNRRRTACFRAATVCAKNISGKKITHLRDVTLEELERCRASLSDEDFRRARHVVTENARALAGAEALEKGDAVRLGALMSESHESSRRDFENSSQELDALVDAARDVAGCYGSRLTGGGFGGAVVNLVEAEAVDGFGEIVKERYHTVTGLQAACHAFTPAAGATGGSL